MEDVALSGPTGSNTSAAAVFDGHGGAIVARTAARNAWTFLNESDPMPGHLGLAAAAADAVRFGGARVESDSFVDTRSEGTTATIALSRNGEYAVAWAGDSDAVLCSWSKGADGATEGQLTAERLTAAHVPARPDEAARVEAAGGFVARQTRMMDDGNEYPYGPARCYVGAKSVGVGVPPPKHGLAVSRSLGDKAFGSVVSGEPEKMSARTNAADGSTHWIMVATDGIWDVMSPLDVAKTSWNEDNGSFCPECASRRVVKAAIGRGSQDNVAAATVIL
jgi:serine/threonine protein phosphatase PrpC